jgi:hypothetical protein
VLLFFFSHEQVSLNHVDSRPQIVVGPLEGLSGHVVGLMNHPNGFRVDNMGSIYCGLHGDKEDISVLQVIAN